MTSKKKFMAQLKGALKSWTAWFSALLMAAPELIPLVQQNWPTISPFIPSAMQSKTVQVIGLIALLLRMKTTRSLAAKAEPTTPSTP